MPSVRLAHSLVTAYRQPVAHAIKNFVHYLSNRFGVIADLKVDLGEIEVQRLARASLWDERRLRLELEVEERRTTSIGLPYRGTVDYASFIPIVVRLCSSSLEA
ncbi:hypothetical protein SUNI508_11899 [Seiridium unicorne]|uniref:Uncharacterized protein n=1 Tax=Seiridium unicorne TaxID=138068 RepID=A0ABR2UGA4_9PEZI